jgi:serine/threonine-protein kinase
MLEGIVPGAIIAGRYRIERLLGEGGMGRVFAARQLGLERPVALKVLRPELARDATALHRFRREARLVASLASEHVVRVHDLGELRSGEPYLVMELLEGEDLGHVVARGPIPAERAIGFIVSACEALAEAHWLGIVHRDIKPSNLFLTRKGSIKVLDFGLAKLAIRAPGTTAMTADGVLLGSPCYMAPEQITEARNVDARADVWSLGATLYHLVSGKPPFSGATLDRIFASIIAGQRPSLDGLPPAIASVISRCLAREAHERYLSVTELEGALRQPLPSLERYEILERIGQGGHGTVYRARQRAAGPHGREVALKVLRADATRLRERFAREAAIVEKLEHPNTVRLFESGHAPDGVPYMVFELVRGRTLAAEIAKGPMAPARVARIASQVLKALMEAHQHGIVHRDVKPENVLLVDHAGEPDFVKLLDFGVAVDGAASERPASGPGQSSLTTTGQVIGTPRYMSPEQVTGAPIDPRTDLYALGLVMAEALGGTPVMQGDSAMAVCMQHASAAPVPLSSLVTSGPLGPIIVRATAKAPHARFGSAREMLDTISAGASVAPPPPQPQPHPHAPTLPAPVAPMAVAPARSKAGSVVAAVVIVVVCIALVAIGGIAFVGYQLFTAVRTSDPKSGGGSGGGTVTSTTSTGRVEALDETRLRTRLEHLGWKITRTSVQDFPGCKHIDFLIDKDTTRNGNVTLFDCSSRAMASSEAARMRRTFPTSWVIDEGSKTLMAAIFDEKASKELAEALLDP